MRTLVFLLALALSPFLNGQMTLKVTVPQYYTPLLEDVYVAGTFNNWTVNDPNFKLTPQADGTHAVQISGLTNGDLIEFKFNRGDWSRVEASTTGQYVPNRQASFLNNTELPLTIAGWEDFPGVSTATGNVNVLGTQIEIPQLNRTRRVWVYLPNDYANSMQHYPVVYMLDGQNVFDAATSFVGEWGVDEAMEALPPDELKAIIVAIDNGGVERTNEYSAWVNLQYGGGQAAEFGQFIIDTLKPLIDEQFRTLPSRNYTAIMGSSLGGLMAMYMVMNHSDVFGRAGVFSPSFWFSNGIYELAESHGVHPLTRIFLLGGTNESATMVANMQSMRSILLERGYPESEVRLEAHSYGTHSETYWGGEYTEVYTWLFADFNSNVATTIRPAGLAVYPNPAHNQAFITNPYDRPAEVMVYGLTGRMVASFQLAPAAVKAFNTSNLGAGMYRIMVTDGHTTRQTQLLINH